MDVDVEVDVDIDSYFGCLVSFPTFLLTGRASGKMCDTVDDTTPASPYLYIYILLFRNACSFSIYIHAGCP